MSLKGLKEFRDTADFQELLNHKGALLAFYASPAFKAQQAWLEAMQATEANRALQPASTQAEVTEARARWAALDQLIKLPQFLGDVLDDGPPPVAEPE